MKSMAYRLALSILLMGSTCSLIAHVALDYPVGGETFIQGQTVTIQWHIAVPHELQNWDLFFSTDGGNNWDTLQMDMQPGQLSFIWEVPAIVITQGRIKIYMENVGMDYVDISMNFSIVENTAPPTLDAPATNLNIECGAGNQQTDIQSWLDNHGGAVASNFCSELVWTDDYDQVSNDCGSTGNAFVTFTATDDCGSTYSIATLTIADTHGPTLIQPASNSTVESDGNGNTTQYNNWLVNHGGAQATDGCGNVNWTYMTVASNYVCGSTGTITINFVAHDPCGNTTTTTAVFSIVDSTAPTLTHPANDLIVECSESDDTQIQSWLVQHGGATATDIGSEVTWSNNFHGLSDECGSTGSAIVQFVASDACGNSSPTLVSLIVRDQYAPVILVSPKDTILFCGQQNQDSVLQNWLDNHGGASAQDACSLITWTNDFATVPNACDPAGVQVHFMASDECGNVTTMAANLHIEDTTPPVIETLPQDTTIICGNGGEELIIQNWLERHGGAMANDLCSNALVSWTNNYQSITGSCDTTRNQLITFSVFDACLNSTSVNAALTVLKNSTSHAQDPADLAFNLYPNPVHDLLTVELAREQEQPVRFSLVDACGKSLWTVHDDSRIVQIPVQGMAPGLYFLHMDAADGTSSRIVIIE